MQTFTQALSSLHAEGDHWCAEAPTDWAQGRTIFGGLQAAFLVAAMRQKIGSDIALRSLQTVFVGPVPAGPVKIRADILRTGKSTIHARAETFSDAGIGCTAIAVFGTSRSSSVRLDPPKPVFDRRPEDSALQPYVEGLSPPFLQHVEQRWSRGAMPYCGGSEADTQIYVRYFEEPAVTEGLIIAFADTIPSPAVSLLKSFAPASSMCWTLELLQDELDGLPTGDWLMDARATSAAGGYVYQTASLWSPDLKPVALSRQSAVIFG
tara:strand:+ start:40800 stop:41594 length:795 start_codon:yes stop_codon:yes gene_type:complete